MSQRRVILLSPHFPPSTLAGVHRARHLAKHLPAHGWEPIVVSADPAQYTEPGDPALARLVPDSVRQVRTAAYPAGLCRRFGVGDIGLRAYPFFARALRELIARERPQAVLLTGSPFYPLLLAGLVKRLGAPAVLDFQDPWVSAHGATLPKASKGGLSHQLAVTLEPRALRDAAFVTSVSETQNAQMAERYPWLDAARMAAIPIGGDPDDFAALKAGGSPHLTAGFINLSYVGTCLPRAVPLFETLLAALADLRATEPGLVQRLRLNFVGVSNQPGGVDDYRILPLAQKAGVADLVRETPQRVPYLEALGVLANSQGLMMIGSDEVHYTASKIYPAMMSGRPFLSLFHRQSSSHAILSAAGGGTALGFSTLDELAALRPAIAAALKALATAPESLGSVDPGAYAAFTGEAVAGRFAEVFDRAGRA